MVTTSYIHTSSGKLVDVLNPEPSMIRLHDISHALSNLCRFGGHTKVFYSVAEHSYRMSRLYPDRDWALEILLHDASEAYLVDIPRPVKKFLPDYSRIEDRLQEVIAKKFKLKHPLPPEIHDFDTAMAIEEADQLLPGGVLYWPEDVIRLRDTHLQSNFPEITLNSSRRIASLFLSEFWLLANERFGKDFDLLET